MPRRSKSHVNHNVFFATQARAPADIDGSNANVSIQRTFGMVGVVRVHVPYPSVRARDGGGPVN